VLVSLFFRARFLDEFPMAIFTDFEPKWLPKAGGAHILFGSFFDPVPEEVFRRFFSSFCYPLGSIRVALGTLFGSIFDKRCMKSFLSAPLLEIYIYIHIHLLPHIMGHTFHSFPYVSFFLLPYNPPCVRTLLHFLSHIMGHTFNCFSYVSVTLMFVACCLLRSLSEQ
jgi:hypothetical protein